MSFRSDNASGVAPQIMAALMRVNQGYAGSYGGDASMDRVRGLIRDLFEAPEAAVYLVATGTAANALSLAVYAQPWTSVLAHETAHINIDECGAPEFYTAGARLALIGGAHGRITPEGLMQALGKIAQGDVHAVQRGMLSLTNVNERGTVYGAADTAALTAIARSHGMPTHLDGARLANALAATGTSPAEMTWKAGIDILSFGGTKNGCMGVEAVVLFDPEKAWEFELRRKRAGHLFSKHRYLSAQMEAYLTDDLWLSLATHANAMADRLATGLAAIAPVSLQHPVEANMLFPTWPEGALAVEAARLVTSWSTSEAEVDAFLATLR
jgi:threonine aldolase